MSDALLLLSSIAAAGIGFLAIGSSQPSQWRRLSSRPPPDPGVVRLLRAAGGISLAASLALLVARDGAAFGILLWGTVTSAAAIAVVLAIAIWSARRRTS